MTSGQWICKRSPHLKTVSRTLCFFDSLPQIVVECGGDRTDHSTVVCDQEGYQYWFLFAENSLDFWLTIQCHPTCGYTYQQSIMQSDSEEQAPLGPMGQVPSSSDNTLAEQGHHRRAAHRDSGYGGSVSSSATPHFTVGPGEEMFPFDEELQQVTGGQSITDVFPSMETTEDHHHPYDIDTPLSPESEGQGFSSHPLDIPSSQHSQRHDNFTPPRGYIQVRHRFSTGSLPHCSALQTQRSTQTQTLASSSSQTQDVVEKAVKFHEGLLQHTEQRLLQRGTACLMYFICLLLILKG